MTEKRGFFSRLKKGLSKTREGFVGKINRVIISGKPIDDDLLEELEEIFITADMGVETTIHLLKELKAAVKKERLEDSEEIKAYIKKKINKILTIDMPNSKNIPACDSPHIILFVGVNGAGKTTCIGKLAHRYIKEGKKVMVAAGDTFRAAAIDQLEVWAKKSGAQIIRHNDGADPSAVAFDAVCAAKARNFDILLIDTAGRLHTKTNLMEGLKKMKRVIQKELPEAPHETLLVLDAALGQNAVIQARQFHNAVELTGFILTKLDGTYKGGVVVNISDSLKIPVKYIGVGEGLEDLSEFDPSSFADALFETEA